MFQKVNEDEFISLLMKRLATIRGSILSHQHQKCTNRISYKWQSCKQIHLVQFKSLLSLIVQENLFRGIIKAIPKILCGTYFKCTLMIKLIRNVLYGVLCGAVFLVVQYILNSIFQTNFPCNLACEIILIMFFSLLWICC